MKNLSFLLLLLSVTACTHSASKTSIINPPTAISSDTTYPNDKDSLAINGKSNGRITRSELRHIIKNHPELNDNLPPEVVYLKAQGKKNEFSSEIGEDDYFELYAYLLEQRNGENKYQAKRKNLIKIYRDINNIFDAIKGGGTYYGHQDARILAYAEYAIYDGVDNDDYIRGYNISKQKTLYLNSIRQLIADELSTNYDIPETERPILKIKMFKTVSDMDSLITDSFYLKMAQKFQYSNY